MRKDEAMQRTRFTRERERESNNEISRKVSPRLPVLIALRESALRQRFVYIYIYRENGKAKVATSRRMDGRMRESSSPKETRLEFTFSQVGDEYSNDV